MSDQAGTNRRPREQSASVALGGCDDEGNRTLRLVSVVEPSSPSDQIQWYVDGQPFGPVMAPGKYDGKVPGDGGMHLLELRVLSPEGVAGDRAEIKFPLCSQNLIGHIRSVDFAERQDDGSLPIRLVSTMEPEGTQATVQWLIDGKPVGGAVPAGVHTTSVEVAGGIRQVELRVLEPKGAQGDLEEVEFPGPQVEARIAVAEFEDDDWDEAESIAVEEFSEDDGVESIAVEEMDDDPVPWSDEQQREPEDSEREVGSESEPDQSDENLESGSIEFEIGPVGQENMAYVGVRIAGHAADLDQVVWSVDSVSVGSSEPGEPHVLQMQADGLAHEVEARDRRGAVLDAVTISAPSPLETVEVVAERLQRDVETLKAEYENSNEHAARSAQPDLSQVVGKFEESSSTTPTTTGDGAVATVHVCPTVTCTDEPTLEPVALENLDTDAQEPLRPLIPVPCIHPTVKHPGGHQKDLKFFGKTVSTITLPCLELDFEHDYDTWEPDGKLPILASGIFKSSMAASAHSTQFVAACEPAKKLGSLLNNFAIPPLDTWLRELLPHSLRPVGADLEDNVYFVNGIFKGWGAADAQRKWIEGFLDGDCNVRLLHNSILESSIILETVTDAHQLHHDYSWSADADSALRSKALGSHCAVATVSVLLHGMDNQAELALIGSSGGSLQTYMAVKAFASRGSEERNYLKKNVSLLHLGCLVHRSEYDWLHDSLKMYENHVDRRDPFARTFSGEVLEGDGAKEGTVLPLADMAAYTASDLSAILELDLDLEFGIGGKDVDIDVQGNDGEVAIGVGALGLNAGVAIDEQTILGWLGLVGPGPIQAAIGNASLELLQHQGTYHSIASNYMGTHERHVKPDVFDPKPEVVHVAEDWMTPVLLLLGAFEPEVQSQPQTPQEVHHG